MSDQDENLRSAANSPFVRPASSAIWEAVAHLGHTYGVDVPGETSRRVQLHVTLEEVAGILGMSRVTISRELGKLLHDGVLVKDKRDIIVLDRDALQQRLPPSYRV